MVHLACSLEIKTRKYKNQHHGGYKDMSYESILQTMQDN